MSSLASGFGELSRKQQVKKEVKRVDGNVGKPRFLQ